MLVRGSNPKWFFNKLDGTVLQPPATISFLENTAPYLPQVVYQDIDRKIPWGQPINIDTAGSIPDNIYLDPHQVYRIEVREGPGQNDPLVFPPVENYSVDGDGSSPDNDALSGKTDNQITNPQFNLVNFSNGATITTAGTYNIAPGWFLTLVGSGSTTLTQNAYNALEGFDNNPPHALQIKNAGWTTATLYQQFANGGLFYNGAVSFSALMEAVTSIAPITVLYSNSLGSSQALIDTENLSVEYSTYTGAIQLSPGDDTDLPPNGYTQLQFILPVNNTVAISNVQLIGSSKAIAYAYEETTPERQADQTFHIYKNELLIKPKDSILTGWDFSLNPWQFSPTGQTAITTQSQYICDNTVLYQKSAPNNLEVYRLGTNMPPDQLVGLQINPTPGAGVNATVFALITYVDAKTIASYWGQYVSSLIRARLFSQSNTTLKCKMRLIYRNSAVPVLSAAEPIASWTGTDPVFAYGWTAIAPSNDPEFVIPNGYDTTLGQFAFPAFSFDEFLLPQQQTTLDNLALVFYTTTPLAPSATNPDVFVMQRGSLVPNRFAVDSNPLTFEENLRRCQYFYEKSYDFLVAPGTLTTNSARFHNLPVYVTAGGNFATFLNSFRLGFKTEKRVNNSIVTFYSPTNPDATNPTISQTGVVDIALYLNSTLSGGGTIPNPNPITNWSIEAPGLSTQGYIYQCHATTSPIITGTNETGYEGILTYHYTCDARPGVI